VRLLLLLLRMVGMLLLRRVETVAGRVGVQVARAAAAAGGRHGGRRGAD
jgi:hypothetical protein